MFSGVLFQGGKENTMRSSNVFWQNVKRISFTKAIASWLLSVFLALAFIPLTAQAAVSIASKTTIPTASANGLEDDATQWGIFQDQGSGTGKVMNVSQPSHDSDKSLELSLLSGSPYVGLHFYRNLASADTATTFQVNFKFYFPTVTPIQALEFTENKWVNNVRYEWALQWDRIGNGGPCPGGNTPQWRIWDGSSGCWRSINVSQNLQAGAWHSLQINGNIVNGQVHYTSFQSDSLFKSLGESFNPVSETGDKLAVAVQLDSDSVPDPYNVFIDQVNFTWS